MIILIKEHEPLANITATGNKPWRMQKMFLDLRGGGIPCRLLMSTFDHWTKTQISRGQLTDEFSDVELLRAPSYPRNNSIYRFLSGIVFAFRVFRAGMTGPRPSQIIVACPGLQIVLVALLLKLRFGCKVYVDVRDNWPATLGGFFPSPLRPMAVRVFTWWLGFLLKFSDHVLVPSENLRGLVAGLTSRPIAKIPFLLDSDLVPDLAAKEGRDMMFLGSLNSFFDYDVFDHAAAYCEANGIILQIMGDGDHFHRMKERFSGSAHVRILGHVPYERALEISSDCRIGLYPYARDRGFDNHETNKLTDYLVMGLTVFSSVPLPIASGYWRPFPSPVSPDIAALASKSEVRRYGMAQFVGSYLDRFKALGLI